MALISLFTQTRAVIGRTSGLPTGGLELDASLQETHEGTAQLSTSEIEDGSVISDNVVLSPRKLTIEAVVSKTPLGLAGLIGSGVTALAGAAGQAAGDQALLKAAITTGVASLGGLVGNAIDSPDGGPKSREPSDVWEYLDGLRVARLPFDVVTALKVYEGMIVTSISAPRNIGTTNVMRFTATLEQPKIVRASTVSLAQVPSAAQAANLGKQAAGGAAAKTSDNSSILFKIFKGS